MTKLLAVFVAGLLCLAPAHVQASPYNVGTYALVQPSELEEDDGEPDMPGPVEIPGSIPQTSYVRKGQPAPFEGVLLNPAASARVSVERENAEAECKIRVDREVAVVSAGMQRHIDDVIASNHALNKRLALEESINERRLENLSSELEREQKRTKAGKWNALYFAGGVLAGVLVIVAGAFAVRGVREAPL